MDLKKHPMETRALGKPQDWDEAVNGPCNVLSIQDCMIDGKPAMESLWCPTAAERAAIAEGAPVVLWVFGTAHPVVSISACDPVLYAAIEAELAIRKAKKVVDG